VPVSRPDASRVAARDRPSRFAIRERVGPEEAVRAMPEGESGMQRLTRINSRQVADITYVPMPGGHAYLCAVRQWGTFFRRLLQFLKNQMQKPIYAWHG